MIDSPFTHPFAHLLGGAGVLKLMHSLEQSVICHVDISVHRSLDTGMTEQLLKYLRLHPTFDCTGCVSVAQSMHTEMLNPCFVTKFIQMGVIAAVFCRHPSTVVDEHQIAHMQRCLFGCPAVNVG